MKAFTRRHYLGLAIGTLWIIVAGAVFAGLALNMIGAPLAKSVFVGEIVAAAALIAINLAVVIAIARLPAGLGPRTKEERIIGRRFGRIVVLEVIAIFVVNGVASIANRIDLIVPLDLIVVGIHFFPLASLFTVPRYNAMGILFCGISALVLLFIPAGQRFGDAAGRFVIPSLGCAATAWCIAVGNLVELRRFLSMPRSSSLDTATDDCK